MPRSSTQPPREPTLLDQPGLLDQPRPGSNMPEFSVGDISRLLKKTVEETFGLVRVRGEISECKYHSSGHVYITLKDESAMLAAVCWRGSVSKLSIRPEVGMEVVCTGRITTYPGQSKYQLVIDGMVLAGMGALLKMLEERKKKLEAEGLFAPDRKRKLPFLPEVIGVITSPTGAVIRDILHRLADRFPRHVLVWPVAVQGEGAAQQVVFAIDGFNLLVASGALPTPDVLIVARGGGSVEDLMAFNEEIVVRAVAASKIPIISAVGHETDTTLIDLAADVRAPTPTAAAEMAVPVRDEILERLLKDGTRLETALRRVVGERREHMSLLARALGDPARVFELLMQRLDEKAERLTLAWTTFVDRRTSRVSEYVARIRHPRDILKLAAQHVEHAAHKIQSCWRASLDRGANRVNEAAAKIRHPRDSVRLSEQNLDHLAHKMQSGWRESLLRQQSRLATAGTVLEHLSPRAVLGRGYALVQDASGQVVMSRSQPKKGDPLRIEFNDGPRQVMVED